MEEELEKKVEVNAGDQKVCLPAKCTTNFTGDRTFSSEVIIGGETVDASPGMFPKEYETDELYTTSDECDSQKLHSVHNL